MLATQNKSHKLRAFAASCLITLVVGSNVRDIPIPHVPLIYLVWPMCMAWISPGLLTHAIKVNRFIVISVGFLGIYLIFLQYVFKGYFRYESFSSFFEPLMIIIFGAVIAMRPSFHQGALDGFLTAIAIATLFGFGVMMIGDPFISFQHYIHTYQTGGLFSAVSDTFINEQELSLLTRRNAGLSLYVPSFSYQLTCAAAMSATMLSFQYNYKKYKTIFKYSVLLIIFLLGIITNAERSGAVAFIFSCIANLWLQNRFNIRMRQLLLSLIVISAFIALVTYVSFDNIYTLSSRSYEMDDEKRFLAALMAILSVILTPIGNGGVSSEYINWAKDVGFIDFLGQPIFPHNHFANFIMYSGWAGVIIIVALMIRFFSILRMIKQLGIQTLGYPCIAFSIGAFAAILNSFAHNHGLFRGEIATCFSMGFIFCIGQMWIQEYQANHRRFTHHANSICNATLSH